MASVLAVIEGVALFALASATLVAERRLWSGAWTGLAVALGEAAAVACGAVAAGYYGDFYDFRVVRTFRRFTSRFVRRVAGVCLLLAGLSLLGGMLPVPEVSSVIVGAALLLAIRAVFYEVAFRVRPFVERVVILGSGPLAQVLVEEIEAQPHRGSVIVGILDGATPRRSRIGGYPVLGSVSDLPRIVREVRPDRVVVALSDRRNGLPIERLLEARLAGVIVEEGAEVYERLTGKIAIEALTPSDIVFGQGFRKSRVALAARRVTSVAVAAIGLVALAPVLGLIALLIRLDSRGPALFVQERVGMEGRRFNLIKFRTMHPADHPPSEWARDNGDRITRVGKWLRKFRLDELPQFVNILRGDMNLVGPRPHPVTNLALFTVVLRNAPECGTEIPYYALRSMVRPGITGWAQVRYPYANDLAEEIEKMRYDVYYIKHMSLWLDLRILFETVKIILRGPDGARSQTRLAPGESDDTRTLRAKAGHLVTQQSDDTRALRAKAGHLVAQRETDWRRSARTHMRDTTRLWRWLFFRVGATGVVASTVTTSVPAGARPCASLRAGRAHGREEAGWDVR